MRSTIRVVQSPIDESETKILEMERDGYSLANMAAVAMTTGSINGHLTPLKVHVVMVFRMNVEVAAAERVADMRLKRGEVTPR